MEYDAIAIGKRIRKCRKEYRNKDYCAGVPDQATFGAILKGDPDKGYDRKVISAWENGERIPPLDAMLRMCELFDCELGYLLCEYDTKTRVATDIQEEIGLSETAIDALRSEDHRIGDTDYEMPNLKLSLVDNFIVDCVPIIGSILYDLFSDSFEQATSASLTPEMTRTKIQIFNEIYFGDSPDHLKPQMFIDGAIKHFNDEENVKIIYDSPEDQQAFLTIQKDNYYKDYVRLSDNLRFDKTEMHRHTMSLVFNQMIDRLLNTINDETTKLMQGIAKRTETISSEERQESDYGEHEKK